METFKEAKRRLIAYYAEPFAKDAEEVFKKMGWTWIGVLREEIYPNEDLIYETICVLLDAPTRKTDEEIDKLGHFHCSIGRINITMFKWEHLKEWDFELTLEPGK